MNDLPGMRPLRLLSRAEVAEMYPDQACVTNDAPAWSPFDPPPFDPTDLAPTLARLAASEHEAERMRREDARRAEAARFAERFQAFMRECNRRRL